MSILMPEAIQRLEDLGWDIDPPEGDIDSVVVRITQTKYASYEIPSIFTVDLLTDTGEHIGEYQLSRGMVSYRESDRYFAEGLQVSLAAAEILASPGARSTFSLGFPVLLDHAVYGPTYL